MKYTLSVLVEDESGVLSRISGLFARRGFNIESLAVVQRNKLGFPVLRWFYQVIPERLNN